MCWNFTAMTLRLSESECCILLWVCFGSLKTCLCHTRQCDRINPAIPFTALLANDYTFHTIEASTTHIKDNAWAEFKIEILENFSFDIWKQLASNVSSTHLEVSPVHSVVVFIFNGYRLYTWNDIIEHARTKQVGLTVLNTHGRHGWKEFILVLTVLSLHCLGMKLCERELTESRSSYSMTYCLGTMNTKVVTQRSNHNVIHRFVTSLDTGAISESLQFYICIW